MTVSNPALSAISFHPDLSKTIRNWTVASDKFLLDQRTNYSQLAGVIRHALTLKAVADVWVAETLPHWSPKHTDQVEQSLRDHVYPTLGGKPIEAVGPGHILDLLEQLLADGKVETARRVRQRLDAIFEYAGVRHELPANPVAMAKREINKRVKAARKVNPEEEFACIPIVEAPQLLRAMRSYVGTPVTRTLLWFVALTACRTGEARYAT
jgi:integrase